MLLTSAWVSRPRAGRHGVLAHRRDDAVATLASCARSRYRAATANAIEVPREFDDYVLGRELGQGVTGHVYLAEDAMLARPVAIKFVANLDAAARQRFLLEARAIAQIQHPNVVGIYRVAAL